MAVARRGFPGTESPRTIADRIYAELRRDLMLLEPEPGSPLDMKVLAERLGVSRSPVREALLRLAGEGLVDIMPQRGTFVSRIDSDRAREERFFRESLEIPALGLFVGEAEEPLFTRCRDDMAAALETQRLAAGRGDFEAFFASDDDFHQAIFTGAGKRRCWEAVLAMSGHYRRLRFLSLRSRSLPEMLLQDHGELFRFISERNEEGSLSAIRRHLARLDLDESALRDAYPGYFA